MIWIAIFINVRGATPSTTNSSPAILTEAEQLWINAHPVVRWGEDPDWPPFSTLDKSNHVTGIDADTVRLATARVGLRVIAVPATSWSEVLAEAKMGAVDFLSATAKTPERLQSFDYTKQYGSFPVIIITRESAPFLTPSADLSFLTISAVRDHVTTWRLQHDYPTAHLVLTDTAEEAITLVSLGKVDATVQNLAVASRVIRVNGLTNLKIAGVTRYEFPLHIAVRKDLPELTAILNKGLSTITPDEEERIYAIHLTPDVARARNWGLWRRRAIYSAYVGAATITLVLLWNCCLAHQIRRRKIAELSLRGTRDRLEKRTHELDVHVAEVERLNSELRMANEDLESFASSVSHDLRSPLRRIHAFAELLKAEAGAGISESEQWASAIIRESKNMSRLVQDLLEFARLGRAELTKQSVNMQELVTGVAADFESQTRDRKVIWEIGKLCEVDGDLNLLRGALSNIIDNALKYSRRRPEARITIDSSLDPSNNRMAIFSVRDNGCGFDMNRATNLFSPFQRLHSNKDYEGTGIGLASVQRIIQKHGGRIWFESEPDKGATFYFTLIKPRGKA